MSLGGSKSQSTTDVRLNGININQSSYGNCIPLVYGRNRLPLTLLWYGNFVSTPHTSTQSGGKGGGSGGGNTTFTYTASMVMGICEGPMSSPIGQVWQDKVVTTVAALGFTAFNGAGGQAPWAYLTTNFPTQAVPYDHTAYVAVPNYALGSSAAIPNFTFEVSGFLTLPGTPITFTGAIGVGAISATLANGAGASGNWNITFSDNETRNTTIVGNAVTWSANYPLLNTVSAAATLGGFDADPSAILIDYCTDPNHGCNFNALGPLQGVGVTTYQSYCYAMGLFLSPYESTQRTAVTFIKEILQITNSDAFMSAGTLIVVPYCDASVTGNGRTYTPNLTPLFAFTEDDLMAGTLQNTGNDPIVVTRAPLADTYNTVRVEYLDRTNAYNTAIAEATDAHDIAVNGVRVMATLTFHEITVGAVAQNVAQLILQRNLYIRSQFTFSVRMDYCLLEPGDLVSITDANLGFLNKLVRLIEVDDDQNDLLTLIAEDMLVGTASAPEYNYQSAQGFAANYGTAPPSVGTPLIFAAPPLLVGENGGYEIWIAADQAAAGSWGGCDVYSSLDNISYIYAGTINGAARYGTLTAALPAHADPDTVDTLSVQLTNPTTTVLQLVSGSSADYANLRTLLYVDGEIMAYQTAALTGAGQYNISTLRRGQYGSTAKAHAASSQFARIDSGIFQMPYDVGMTGQTMYFKFCSFNIYGNGHQTLAAATAYPYLLQNNNAGQLQPNALTLIGNNVTTSGPTAFKSGGATNAWNASVYTDQSYTNGCSLSAYCGQITSGLMIGLAYNPALSDSYTNLAFAFFCASNGSLGFSESGVYSGIGLGSYNASTQLNVVYDGKYVTYNVNGIPVRSVPLPTGTFSGQICFSINGDLAYGIEFDSVATSTTALTLINANTNSVCSGSRAHKVGGGNGNWDTSVYSQQNYINGCSLSANMTIAGGSMIGLTGSPTASVSYTNLQFALYSAAGNYYIYESGAQVPTGVGAAIWGQANANTLFAITYDGKHVSYYVGGALIRTVAITGQTFFAQICLAGINDLVQNVDFGPLTMNTSTYTLIPMSNGVAASGTRATALLVGGAGYGSRCFKSLESFGNGAILSAQISPNVGAQFIGLSPAPFVGDTSGVDVCLASIYPHPDSACTHCVMVGGLVFTHAVAPVAGDVYTVEYDLYNFYWFINNVLIYQAPYTGAPPLYLFGDFYEPGLGFVNISFYANGRLSPNPWVATGYAVTHDSTAVNVSPTGAWDSAVYSINSYKTAHIQAKVNPINQALMIGLTATPPPLTGNSSYASLGYSWYSTPTGVWYIYEGVTYVGNYGAAAITDLVAVTYDGATVTYWLNGVSKRTVSIGGLIVYGMVAFAYNGAAVNNLSFGPGTALDTVGTASLDPNAASQIVSTYAASVHPFTVYGISWAAGGSVTNSIVGVNATLACTGSPVAVDLTMGALVISTLAGTTGWSASVTVWRDGAAITGVPLYTIGSGVGSYWVAGPNPQNFPCAFTFVDPAPPVGTHTYQVVMSGGGSGNSGSSSLYNVTLKVREIKK